MHFRRFSGLRPLVCAAAFAVGIGTIWSARYYGTDGTIGFRAMPMIEGAAFIAFGLLVLAVRRIDWWLWRAPDSIVFAMLCRNSGPGPKLVGPEHYWQRLVHEGLFIVGLTIAFVGLTVALWRQLARQYQASSTKGDVGHVHH